MAPVTPVVQQSIQQAVQQTKVAVTQNQTQHPNHDLSQQKSIAQHPNQVKQQWNHTGQTTGAQVEDRLPDSKSSDWAPSNQIPQQPVTPNYHSGQEIFGNVPQQQVQSSQVPMGYVPGQLLPQQSSQLPQINIAKPQTQSGKFNQVMKFRA